MDSPVAERVLVVDDDAEVRHYLMWSLRELGYEVALASGGAEAMAMLAAESFDLVVCDVAMPEMTGLELTAKLRGELHNGELPVLLLSGSCETETFTRGLDAGANDFLRKPVVFDELAARVRAHLRQVRVLRTLRTQTIVDELTGAYNRRGLMDGLVRELSRAQRLRRTVSLLLVDVDGFKGINDAYGHAIGDIVLRDLVELLKSNTRSADIVARLGGDEFVVVLPDTSESRALQIAVRLQWAAERRTVPGTSVPLGISVGLATAPCGDVLPENFLASADDNMYGDKRRRTGGHEVVVTATLAS